MYSLRRSYLYPGAIAKGRYCSLDEQKHSTSSMLRCICITEQRCAMLRWLLSNDSAAEQIKHDDVASLRQLETNKSTGELQKKACLKQLHLPIFYISVLYAAAGFLFTISELQFGFSASSLQNIYLTGSTLYLCGSIGILGRAWMNVSNEWDLLQQSRMALYAMTSRGLNLEIL